MTDTKDLAPAGAIAPIGAAALIDNIKMRDEVMDRVMRKDVHFGIVPGTRKYSLYKAGAEVLVAAFQISTEVDVTDLSGEDQVRYVCKVRGIHIPTQVSVGVGVGECSSNEEKYKWRRAVCDEEWEYFPEARRRVKWFKGRGGAAATSVKQVRTEPADVANTILKMSKTRALRDFALTALGASDRFVQDFEDMPAELREQMEGAEGVRATPAGPQEKKPPQAKASGGGKAKGKAAAGVKTVSEAQAKLLYARLAAAKITMEQFEARFGVGNRDLPAERMDEALKWIDTGGGDDAAPAGGKEEPREPGTDDEMPF